MPFINEARGSITETVNTLIRRRKEANSASEKAEIDQAIDSLTDIQSLLTGAAMLNAAELVLKATGQVEKVIRSASLNPVQGYLEELGGAVGKFNSLLQGGELGERLDSAADQPAGGVESTAAKQPTGASEASQPATPSPSEDAPPAIADPTRLPPIATRKEFNKLASEYSAWFNTMEVRANHRQKAGWYVAQLMAHEERYRSVSSKVNDIPWALIGIIHGMECAFNFACHLHNGDPLTARTSNQPSGRPREGAAPFSWEFSAADALTLVGLNTVPEWSIPRMLHSLEKYNGFGYRMRGLATPYLWSFSNHYAKGKFVKDRVFDPEAVSKQCGAAVMLKLLLDRGAVVV